MAILYQHRRSDTGEIFYIGIGKNEKRAYSKQQRGKFWKDFVKNHIYTVEILLQDIPWKEACYAERYLIAFYGRRDFGLGPLVNMTDGGEGATGTIKIITDEFREKCRERMKGKTWEELYGKEQAEHLRKIKAEQSRNRGILTEYVRKNGAPNKGKTLGPQSLERKLKAGNSIKKARMVMTEESKTNQAFNFRKNNPVFKKMICEHCGKEAGLPQYKQWHGNNCKSLKFNKNGA